MKRFKLAHKALLPAVGVSLLAFPCICAALPPATGWRTGGTGAYPDAAPPTVWAKDKNVVWSCALPNWSNATPLLSGDKIFVCAEPDQLVCVSAADGKVLWSKAHPLEESFSEEQKAMVRQEEEKLKSLKEQHAAIGKEFDEAKKAFDADKTAPELKARMDGHKNRRDDVAKEMGKLQNYATAFTHGANGYTTSTPVSDGSRVFVQTGLGVVACYDLTGQRKWIRFLEKPVGLDNCGHCASPSLLAGKLLVPFNRIHALNSETGETLWSADAAPAWGTPIPGRIGETEVLFTSRGDVLRASDGKLLAGKLANIIYGAPVLVDDMAFCINGGDRWDSSNVAALAYKLPQTMSDPLKLEPLWTTPLKKDEYYASLVVTKGFMYAVTKKAVLTVLAAKDGAKIHEKDLSLGAGTVYPSIAAAGNYVYVSSDNGATLVLEAAAEYKEVARNTLETFRSCPVFAGRRMYIRAYSALYCIGE